MIATVKIKGRSFKVNLNKSLDISITMSGDGNNLTAWYQNPPVIDPVIDGDFVGSVKKGGVVNFMNIFFNPHAHGTHTECVGHISKENVYLSDVLLESFFLSQVITITPEQRKNGDEVITFNQLKYVELENGVQAIIIRTLPNQQSKLTRQYSHTNPPYVEPEAMAFLVGMGVDHFLIDSPSVDREEDDGLLLSHRTFWNYPNTINKTRTITELIYVRDEIEDGMYLLNLQTANFKNDAAPSRPVLFKLENI